MINIIRDLSNVPECLSQEKDKELSGKKQDGNYRCEGVVKRIKHDFCEKCYICELSKPTSINVEHFKPHRDKNIDLKFDFKNLFYACQHCNNCKSDDFENILDCTNPNEDVENWIEYKIELVESSKVELTIIKVENNLYWNEDKIMQTIKLLDKIYNGEHTEIKIDEGENLRNLLIDDMFVFYEKIKKYLKNAKYPNYQKDDFEYIRLNLRNDSSFTAFKRWVIKRSPKLEKEFKQYFE